MAFAISFLNGHWSGICVCPNCLSNLNNLVYYFFFFLTKKALFAFFFAFFLRRVTLEVRYWFLVKPRAFWAADWMRRHKFLLRKRYWILINFFALFASSRTNNTLVCTPHLHMNGERSIETFEVLFSGAPLCTGGCYLLTAAKQLQICKESSVCWSLLTLIIRWSQFQLVSAIT